MTPISSETIHASCVSIGRRGVLITGPSGSGKSDLALRLIDRGATLVSDDYTIVRRNGDRLVASAPPNITGLIEIRGIGLVAMPFETDIPVALIVSIAEEIDRMPDDLGTEVIAGVGIPKCAIIALEASAPIKVEQLLTLKGLK